MEPNMFDNPGEMTAILTVTGFMVTAFGGCMTYINARITKVEVAMQTSSDAARLEMANARLETTRLQDKIWDALESHRKEVAGYQASAQRDRNAMAAEMATKADLHREVDRLALIFGRPAAHEAAGGSD